MLGRCAPRPRCVHQAHRAGPTRLIGSPAYPTDEERLRRVAGSLLGPWPQPARRAAPDARDQRVGRPHRGPAQARPAGDRHPRHPRHSGPSQRRPRHGQRHPRRPSAHLRGHGPRPSPCPLARSSPTSSPTPPAAPAGSPAPDSPPRAGRKSAQMRLRGVEPPRALAHTDLNRARLPVPPQPREPGNLPTRSRRPRPPRPDNPPAQPAKMPLLAAIV